MGETSARERRAQFISSSKSNSSVSNLNVFDTEQKDDDVKRHKDSLLSKTYRKNVSVYDIIDAPLSINPYPKKTEPELMALVASIEQSGGIINEVILIEAMKPDCDEIILDGAKMKYIAISGHSRRDGSKWIYENKHISKYEYVPAKIFEYGSINEDEMAIISHDENNQIRDKIPSTIAYAIKHYVESEKVAKLLKRSGATVRTGAVSAALEYAMKVFNTQRRAAERYYAMSRLSLDFLREFVDTKKITVKQAERISRFAHEENGQEIIAWISDQLTDGKNIDKKNIMKLKPGMTFTEIKLLLQKKKSKSNDIDKVREVKVRERHKGVIEQIIEILENNPSALEDLENGFVEKYTRI